MINGATDSSYSVSQSEIQNVGTTYFYVQISGVLGNDSLNAIVSNISTLTVSPVPIIIVNVEPLNQSVQMNQKTNLPTFSVNAQSNNSKAVLSYQWYSNTTNSTLGAVAINNATNSSYTVPSTDALTIGTKYFFVKISGTVEGIKMNSLNSHIASLNVDVAHLIKITTQPISQTVIVGQTQNLPTLSITASTINDANLTYQWYSNTIYSTKGATPVPNGTNSSLVFSSEDISKVGTMYFYAMITEVVQGVNVATTNSDIISLVIKPVPFVSVINQPSNEDVIINQKQNLPVLSVTATSDNENVNLNYQWYENSKNSTTDAVLIKGATNPSYLIRPDQVTTLGRKYFFVRISGLINGIKLLPVDSKVISLTTTSVPLISILTSPQNQTGIVHQTENLPTFSVEVNNIKNAVFTYQWYENSLNNTTSGQLISSATSSSYTVPKTDLITAGSKKYFYVKINASVNGVSLASIYSTPAALIVNDAPAITINNQPQNLSSFLNQTENLPILTVGVNDIENAHLTYQWYSNKSESTTTGSEIIGATNSSYQIIDSDVKAIGATYYYVKISGTIYGAPLKAITSGIAKLQVSETPSISFVKQPQNQTAIINQTLNLPTLSVEVNSIKDAKLSYQWYENNVNSNENGIPIKNATTSTYNIPVVDAKTAGTKYFYVKVSGIVNGALLNPTVSNAAHLSIGYPTLNNATNALKLWLASEANQRSLLTSYMSRNNILNLLAGPGLYGYKFTTIPNATIESLTYSQATAENKLGFNAWKVVAKTTSNGIYSKWNTKDNQYVGNNTIASGTLITFYLPFSLTANTTVTGGGKSTTVTNSLNVANGSSSLSFSTGTTSSGGSADLPYGTNDPIYAVKFETDKGVLIDALSGARYQAPSFPTFNNTNSDLPAYGIYSLPQIRITTQPKNENINLNQTQNLPILSVKTQVIKEGELSYQWYESNSNSTTDGTAIPGATESSYQIPVDFAKNIGKKYFYVKINGTFNGIPLVSVSSNPITVSVGYTNADDANNALKLWLSSQANQKILLESYFKNSENILKIFNGSSVYGTQFVTVPNATLENLTFETANSTNKLGFSAWKIVAKTTSEGTYKQWIGSGYGSPITLPTGTIITFYLPFNFTNNESISAGEGSNIKTAEISKTLDVSSGVSSLSFNVKGILNNPNNYIPYGTNDPLFSVSFVHNGAVIKTLEGASYQLLNLPSFTNSNSDLPSYGIYPLPNINIGSFTANQNVVLGQTTNLPTFSVMVNNIKNADLSYQWYENNSNSNTGGTLIPGATKQTYTIPASDALKLGAKYFYVRISGTLNGLALNPIVSSPGMLKIGYENVADATNALKLWLASEANQRSLLTSYMSRNNILNLLAGPGLYGYKFTTIPNATIESLTYSQVTAENKLGFNAWKVVAKTTSNGIYSKWSTKDNQYVGNNTIASGTLITFYLPFSLTANTTVTGGGKSTTVTNSLNVANGSSSLSFSTGTTSSGGSVDLPYGTNDPIYAVKFETDKGVLIDALSGARYQAPSFPTFNNTNSDLPTYYIF